MATSAELAEIGLESGFLKLKFNETKKRLEIVTEYISPRKLTDGELEELHDWTTGQWSDGIGESAFDNYTQKTGISIDIGQHGRQSSIAQKQVGAKPATKLGSTIRRALGGRSKLLKAAASGTAAEIRKLIESGENTNERGKDGFTPLMNAISEGNDAAALALIEGGADLTLCWTETSGKKTLLAAAALLGRVQVVQALLHSGCDPNECSDTDSHTPIWWAVSRKRLAVTRRLIDAERLFVVMTWMTDLCFSPQSQI